MTLGKSIRIAATVLALAAFPQFANTTYAGTAAQSQDKSDAISGDWQMTLSVSGMSVDGDLTLKVEDGHVTGKVRSDHTGAGTLADGTYADNKLSFRRIFPAHESIDATATLKDGKLVGEFRTEGMQGTWEAKRK